MPNNPLDTHILDKAISYAVAAHAGTERRGKGFPYIIHPLEALTIVSSLTTDQELLAAAVLHDVVEDTDCTLEQIRDEFGDRVAEIVESESDPKEDSSSPKASWRERKIAGLERLTYASMDSKIVAMGDKLSNMRTIAQDYTNIGDKLWSRFHAPNGIKDYAWRYRALAGALAELQGSAPYEEFVSLIDQVFGPDTEHAAMPINMSDFEQTGDGYTALSYTHKDGKRLVKMYNDTRPKEYVMRELEISRALVKMGLNVPKPLRFVTDGKRYGAEFERISKKVSFARSISQDASSLEKFGILFAQETKKLHSTHCPTDIFTSVADFYRQAVDTSHFLTENEKSRYRAFIDSVPECDTCVHGDLHIGNIITDGTQNWWIDLGDFRYGNPLFDFGMCLFATKCIPEELIYKLFHISGEQMRKCWDVFVREYFGADTPEKLEEVDNKVAPFTNLQIINLAGRDGLEPFMREFLDKHPLK